MHWHTSFALLACLAQLGSTAPIPAGSSLGATVKITDESTITHLSAYRKRATLDAPSNGGPPGVHAGDNQRLPSILAVLSDDPNRELRPGETAVPGKPFKLPSLHSLEMVPHLAGHAQQEELSRTKEGEGVRTHSHSHSPHQAPAAIHVTPPSPVLSAHTGKRKRPLVEETADNYRGAAGSQNPHRRPKHAHVRPSTHHQSVLKVAPPKLSLVDHAMHVFSQDPFTCRKATYDKEPALICSSEYEAEEAVKHLRKVPPGELLYALSKDKSMEVRMYSPPGYSNPISIFIEKH